LLRCECGHDVSCKMLHVGEHLGFVAFHDAQQASETFGEQVTRCPGCDAPLD
jgi:hypothetical protein